MKRCDETELPVDQCAHCLKHTGEPDKVPAISVPFPAKHPGRCGHCDDFFPEGTEVAAAIIDGERKWCIAAHTTR